MVEHDIVSVIGALSLIYCISKLLCGLVKFVFMYFTKATIDYTSFGEWALVTGSTDGIGKGIASQLAKRGLNIFLVSRNWKKLQSVAQKIEKNFSVKTKCVAIDFSKTDDFMNDEITSSMYDVIKEGIQDLEIGILVNNVGIGADGVFLNAFSKSDNKDVSTGIPRLVYCNDMSMARVTALVLPRMVERKKGLIVNVSSLSATVVIPGGALYAGSKRFSDVFTKALSQEYKDKGIIFQCVQPGGVRTNMTSGDGRKASKTFPEFETYVESLMETIGKDIETTGYLQHALIGAVVNMLSEFLVAKFFLKSQSADE